MARFTAPAAKLQSFLGLARRAGELTLGRSACRRAVQQGRCHLLVLAQGAGRSVARDSGAGPTLPVFESEWSREELGQRLGRTQVAVVGVTDGDLARGLLQVAQELPEDEPA